MNVAPVTLSGRHVRLEPMTIEHAEPLAKVGLHPELWRLQPRPVEIRVVFKTETGNEPSRRAILRLGAVEEGTFRQHLIAASGRRRDMVYFAILESEWPAVKVRLRSRLK